MRCIDAPDAVVGLPQRYIDAKVTMVFPEPAAIAWIAALHSGEYKQTRGTLCRASIGGMCCLGVEQDVNYGLIEVNPDETDEEHVRNFAGYPSENYLQYTRKAFFDACGERGNVPSVLYNGRWETVANLNDDKKLSFPKIAEVVRPHIAVYPALPHDLVRHDTVLRPR